MDQQARVSKLLAGSSWIGEYGDPDDKEDKEMRPYLKSYSPYHQVRPDISYPDVFLLTSRSDDRVHPGHARKMAKKIKTLLVSIFIGTEVETALRVFYKLQKTTI